MPRTPEPFLFHIFVAQPIALRTPALCYTDTSTQIQNTPATAQHLLLLLIITYFYKCAPDRENCVQTLHWFLFALPLKYRGGRGGRAYRGEGFCTPKNFPRGQKPTTEGNSSIFLGSAKYYHRLIAQSWLLIWLFILCREMLSPAKYR